MEDDPFSSANQSKLGEDDPFYSETKGKSRVCLEFNLTIF